MKQRSQTSKGEFVRTSLLKADSNAMYEVREIPEIKGAEYDELGFYNLPDGSFYDPDGHYFDQDGYDEFGGYYDDDNIYIPGKNADMFNNESGAADDYDDRFENDELAKQLEDDSDIRDNSSNAKMQDKLYQQYLKEQNQNGESFVDQ